MPVHWRVVLNIGVVCWHAQVQRDKKTKKPLMEGGKARILTSHTLNPVRPMCLL